MKYHFYKIIIIIFSTMILLSVGAKDVFAWSNYLKWTIVNPNQMFKPGEGQRFLRTLNDFEYRLKLDEGTACDPRGIADKNQQKVVYLAPGSRPLRNCRRQRKSDHPSPTNVQFRTHWDPFQHKYQTGYLKGSGHNIRNVRIGLFRKETGGWTQKGGYSCRWTIDGKVDQTPAPCRFYYRKLKLGKHRASVEILKSGRDAITTQEFQFEIKDLLLLAVGDSFGSGEGNPHRYPVPATNKEFFYPKPALWLEPRCHRSLFASSSLVTNLLADKYDSGRTLQNDPSAMSVSLLHTACSGAESSFGLTREYSGKLTTAQVAKLWNRAGTSPRGKFEKYLGYENSHSQNPPSNSSANPAPLDLASQLNQIEEALDCNGQPCRRADAVLVYMGVNDIGFSSQVIDLVLGCERRQACMDEAAAQVASGLEQVKANLKSFNNRLKSLNIAPQNSKRIYLIGYPNPLTRRGSTPTESLFCDDRQLFDDGENRPLVGGVSLLGIGISRLGARWATDNILKPLNQELEKFAAQDDIQWSFLETENSALGHGYCSQRRWFNTWADSSAKQGLDPTDHVIDTSQCDPTSGASCTGRRVGNFPSGTMHPNLFGHRQIASLIYDRLVEDLDLDGRRGGDGGGND